MKSLWSYYANHSLNGEQEVSCKSPSIRLQVSVTVYLEQDI